MRPRPIAPSIWKSDWPDVRPRCSWTAAARMLYRGQPALHQWRDRAHDAFADAALRALADARASSARARLCRKLYQRTASPA